MVNTDVFHCQPAMKIGILFAKEAGKTQFRPYECNSVVRQNNSIPLSLLFRYRSLYRSFENSNII